MHLKLKMAAAGAVAILATTALAGAALAQNGPMHSDHMHHHMRSHHMMHHHHHHMMRCGAHQHMWHNQCRSMHHR